LKRDGSIVRAYDLLTVTEAASKLDVSPSWIYQMINKGTLDYYEIGNKKLVHRRDINRIQEQRVG